MTDTPDRAGPQTPTHGRVTVRPRLDRMSNPRSVVIVDALRTPIGRRGGGLSSLHPAEVLARVQTAS